MAAPSSEDLIRALEHNEPWLMPPPPPQPRQLARRQKPPSVFACGREDTLRRIIAAAGASDLVNSLSIAQGEGAAQTACVGRGSWLELKVADPAAAICRACAALQHNTSVTRLVLERVEKSKAAVDALAASIARSSTLRSVRLAFEARHHLGSCRRHCEARHDHHLDNEDIAAIAAALAANCTLRELTMSLEAATDKGMAAFFAGVGENDGLKSLHLRHVTVLEEGGRAAGAALACHACLKGLTLTDANLAQPGAAAMLVGLARNKSMLRLYLDNTHMSDEASAALGKAVASHPCLRTLRLRKCRFQTASFITHELGLSSSLLHLTVYMTRLPQDCMAALAAALQYNGCLTELILTRISLGDEDAATLSKALEHNRTLQILCLCHNMIGDAGAHAIGDMLARNRRLGYLYLTGNSIGFDGLRHLCTGLKRNTAVFTLKATVTADVDEPQRQQLAATEAITDLLRCNTSLTDVGVSHAVAQWRWTKLGNAMTTVTLASNMLFFSEATRDRTHAIQPLCRVFASLCSVLGAIERLAACSAAPLLLPSILISDVLFSLSRAIRPQLEREWGSGRLDTRSLAAIIFEKSEIAQLLK